MEDNLKKYMHCSNCILIDCFDGCEDIPTCQECKDKMLAYHDKQIRDEVIEMYHAKLYSRLLRMPWINKLTNKEVMELNDKVAEQMKGEQNE